MTLGSSMFGQRSKLFKYNLNQLRLQKNDTNWIAYSLQTTLLNFNHFLVIKYT